MHQPKTIPIFLLLPALIMIVFSILAMPKLVSELYYFLAIIFLYVDLYFVIEAYAYQTKPFSGKVFGGGIIFHVTVIVQIILMIRRLPPYDNDGKPIP